METLIKHGGRTTQAEIRYETGLPRSSLTMVLVSLERRNLITKKEWGRTNVIELSESFFSKKEQS
ncbi:helix-turn-helix domain-containing protein [Methanothrix sp.]|uniref:helix-turn-helix transcriptional regulator n=1 Tax=Methanothrix sp. TaxID=90426 RepID=UPI003299E8FB